MIDLTKKSFIERAAAGIAGMYIGATQAELSAKKAEEQQRKMEAREMEWLREQA